MTPRPLALALALSVLVMDCARVPGPAAPAARALRVALPAGLMARDIDHPAHEEFATSILGNVFETLVEIRDDLSVGPGLAESWHCPDERTWIFTLRPGLRLHDGRALDAAMAVAAINRRLSVSWGRTHLEPVAEVRAEGARDVVFRTREPFLSLPERLDQFMIDGGPGPDGAPVGSGPYRIVEWKPDGHVALQAIPGHRKGGTGPPRVEFLPARDGALRVRLLREHKADLALDVPPDEMVRLANEGFATTARPGLRVIFLGMDVRSPSPFRDPRLRAAVSLAADRAGLVAGPLRGFGEPTVQIAADGQIGHDRSLLAPPRDEATARALLAAAGRGPGLRLELDYVPGKYLEIDAVVVALAGQLNAAGLQVVPRPRPYAELIDLVESRRSPFYVLGWLDDSRSLDSSYATLFHTPSPNFGSVNGGGYSNPRVDELIEQAQLEEDAPHRGEMLREVTRVVVQDWPIAPLYRQSDLYAHDRKLRFRPRLDRSVIATEFSFAP
ncbi:MAG: ABC transporter substrate-binding protein [Vicinamibacteria bacterium]|nr:ABC transporter substrate-binding protein [Vicinamibacteria bacterium]